MRHLIATTALIVLAHAPAQAGAPIGLDTSLYPGSLQNLITTSLADATTINSTSVVITLDQATVFIDPVGDQQQFSRFGRPDIVVLTRAAPTHLSIDTMIGMLRRDTVVLAPQEVIDRLPLMISNNVITPFEVGMTQIVDGITFTAWDPTVPVPDDTHVFTRNGGSYGVIITTDGSATYF